MIMNKKNTIYISCLILTLGFLILGIGQSKASYVDTETLVNSISVGKLDMELSNQSVFGFVGMESGGEYIASSEISFTSGSIGVKYDAILQNADSACDDFSVTVTRSSDTLYTGSVSGFTFSPQTDVGNINFEFDIVTSTSISHGEECNAEFLFRSWPDTEASFPVSGFTDTESIDISLTAKMIVLNEVLAHPDTLSLAPDEFIEIVNNGNSSVDVNGWLISEETLGGEDNMYTITTAGGSHTADPGASTTIPAGGYIALYLSDGTALNNTGDTIRLYDNSSNLFDEYTYANAKFGASDARVPDGTGDWVDPVPTPGRRNLITDSEPEEVNFPQETTDDIQVTEFENNDPLIDLDLPKNDTSDADNDIENEDESVQIEIIADIPETELEDRKNEDNTIETETESIQSVASDEPDDQGSDIIPEEEVAEEQEVIEDPQDDIVTTEEAEVIDNVDSVTEPEQENEQLNEDTPESQEETVEITSIEDTDSALDNTKIENE